MAQIRDVWRSRKQDYLNNYLNSIDFLLKLCYNFEHKIGSMLFANKKEVLWLLH